MSTTSKVFFCGHRKSGTTLLVNLFDGHPDLRVYPHDIKVLYAYFPEFIKDGVAPAARRERLQRLLHVDLQHKLRELGLVDAFDATAFFERFSRGLRDGALTDMSAILERIAAALPGEGGKPAALKETSIELYADQLFAWCPDAKVVQLVRDPRDNYAALRAGVERYYEKLGQNALETLMSLLFRCVLGFRAATENPKRFGEERYKVVRFEDLVGQPEQTLQELTDFIGIPFHPTLLTPTVFGSPTAGNNHDGASLSAISEDNVGRWKSRISLEEAHVIEHMFADLMPQFHYLPTASPAERATAVSKFYQWANYRYFFADPYKDDQPLPKEPRA